MWNEFRWCEIRQGGSAGFVGGYARLLRCSVHRFGDALIVLPSHVGNLNGVAAIESTTVRINGEMILDLAIELRRHPGHDITLEADKEAGPEADQ